MMSPVSDVYCKGMLKWRSYSFAMHSKCKDKNILKEETGILYNG